MIVADYDAQIRATRRPRPISGTCGIDWLPSVAAIRTVQIHHLDRGLLAVRTTCCHGQRWPEAAQFGTGPEDACEHCLHGYCDSVARISEMIENPLMAAGPDGIWFPISNTAMLDGAR